jgi:hypothetical protein
VTNQRLRQEANDLRDHANRVLLYDGESLGHPIVPRNLFTGRRLGIREVCLRSFGGEGHCCVAVHGELLDWAKITMPNATVPRRLGSANRRCWRRRTFRRGLPPHPTLCLTKMPSGPGRASFSVNMPARFPKICFGRRASRECLHARAHFGIRFKGWAGFGERGDRTFQAARRAYR